MHQNSEMNCGFFNPNWENSVSIDQNDPFESAFSSMVSSPTASNNAGNGENIVLRELIGRLGSICNSGEISPQPYSTNTSCYATPLNSPPKLNLSSMISAGNLNFPGLPSLVAPFSTDPEFSERAARFSCFANKNGGQLEELVGSNSVAGKISRVSDLGKGELGLESRENSSVSEQIPPAGPASHSRKRKSVPKGKGKETTPPPKDPTVSASENCESSAKRSKSDYENGNEKDDSKTKSTEKTDTKPQEPPKDYIHVRARRGQATDAHSLAERVRREKISERMKVLQDLVPGCNKVTGKAVMLDEIINYVQSLQRQVEFLSMKLSTVNPRMEFNTEALMSKDMFRSHGSFPHNVYASEGYLMQSQANLSALPNGTEASHFLVLPTHFNARNQTVPMSAVDSFSEATSQVLAPWEDDLHSVVQMGYGQNQTQNFHGILPSPQMKVEL